MDEAGCPAGAPAASQCIVSFVEEECDGTETQTSEVPWSSHVSTSNGSVAPDASVNQRQLDVGQSA